MKDIELLKALSDAPSISGDENNVRTILKKEIDKVTFSKTDALGNIYGEIGNGLKILAVGHMDEVGFMVSKIENDGKIRFSNVGFIFNISLGCQRVSIITNNGIINGLVAHPHEVSMKEYPSLDQLWIEVGCSSKEEVENLGIEVGNSIVWKNDYIELQNNIISGKAWDNRVGCAISVKVLQELANKQLNVKFIGGGTVQEEVGSRGAKALGMEIKPDIAISLDTAPCFEEDGSYLGKGPQLFVMDSGVIAHKKLLEYVKKIAKENNIPYQLSLLRRGGTDASEFQNVAGSCPSICLGIPVKFIHTPISTMSYDDYENAIKLMVKVVESLNEVIINEIKSF